MKNYLRWSLRQLYLLYFWPTQFRREVEGNTPSQHELRASEWAFYVVNLYLVKTLPWIVALAVLGNLVAGYTFEALGRSFNWADSWFGVAVGAAVCAAVGAAGVVVFSLVIMPGGVALGVVFGVWFSVWVGVTFGVAGSSPGSSPGSAAGVVAFGLLVGLLVGVRSSVLVGVTFDMWIGVAFGVLGGVALGLVFGLFFDVALGIAGGVALGVALGVAFWSTYFRLLTYPLDAALSTAAYLVARWRLSRAARAWRWCPVAWNEVIWLPLPFVRKLLALLLRQDRKEGFRQIAFVAAERRLQRRAAMKALAEVVLGDLHAESVSELADVTDRLGWTTETPIEVLQDELTKLLPRFDRVAQHAGQYLTLNSPYRKKDALSSALAELEGLQRSLITASGSLAPRLLRTANVWRGLLEAEREKLKALTEAAREIPNPFVFGNPVRETEHNVFAGRRDIVKEIEASVLGARQTPTLLLHGARRMGKTSILLQLPQLLGPDFAPAVIDCQNPAVMGSAATLLRYLSRAVSEGLRRRRVGVEPLAAKALEREPFAVFDEWLEGVERAMPEGMRALLCLDEYERLQATLDAGWGGSFLDALRHTLQHRPRLVLMFTGAHTFRELGPAWTDRFISARRVRVSFLTRPDVELLLTKPIPEFDMTYAPGALDAVVEATSCHPFLTQAVAFELVQLLNEQQRREATPEDVEAAIGRALVSGDAYFVNVWTDAGGEGQAVLRAVAAGETPPDFPVAREWLREHDVLNSEGEFAVEMVKRWVRTRASEPR